MTPFFDATKTRDLMPSDAPGIGHRPLLDKVDGLSD